MTPAFQSAGKAILNSVYQICAEHEVPTREIPRLLQQLAFAVARGQSDKPEATGALLRIETLPKQEIARRLGIY